MPSKPKPKHTMPNPMVPNLLARKEINEHNKLVELQKKLIEDHLRHRKKKL
ncbi:MAG: hypothetical protein WCF78_00295 [archaeon]